jgi:hypothetical protein
MKGTERAKDIYKEHCTEYLKCLFQTSYISEKKCLNRHKNNKLNFYCNYYNKYHHTAMEINAESVS